MATVIVNPVTNDITVTVGSGGVAATWDTIEGKPSVMPQAEAEVGVATTERTISALVMSQAIAAHGVPAESVPVNGISNSVGGAYVVGRTNQTPGEVSRAVPLSSNPVGGSVVLRSTPGHIEATTFIVAPTVQSGSVLSFSAGCTKHESLSADKTYSFSSGVDGAGMQLQVTNTGISDITIGFTGGKLAKNTDGVIGVGEYAIFTICHINGLISVTKTVFDVT